jgi:hypothetical protein
MACRSLCWHATAAPRHKFDIGPAQDVSLIAPKESGVCGVDQLVTQIEVFQEEKIRTSVDEQPQLLPGESQFFLRPLALGFRSFQLLNSLF